MLVLRRRPGRRQKRGQKVFKQENDSVVPYRHCIDRHYFSSRGGNEEWRRKLSTWIQILLPPFQQRRHITGRRAARGAFQLFAVWGEAFDESAVGEEELSCFD